MGTDNQAVLVGNVTKDPKLRFTPSGRAVVLFTVAVNRRWRNQSTQEWDEATSFFPVEAWSGLAENVSESIAKGTHVIASGRWEQENWTTPDGDRSRIKFIADEVGTALKFATAVVTKVNRSGPGAETNGAAEVASTPAAAEEEEPF